MADSAAPADGVTRFARVTRVLFVASIGLSAVGLAVAVAGHSALFAPYTQRFAQAFFGAAEVPAHALSAKAFLFAVLGGSIAGKWCAAAFLTRYAFARRERWAYVTAVGALGAWFVLDSGVSLARGAAFNVLLINLAPIAFVGVPLAFAWPAFARASGAPRQAQGAAGAQAVDARLATCSRAIVIASSFVGLVGIGLALAGQSPLFVFFDRTLGELFWGPEGPPARAAHMVAFLYGPVGATILGHMVLLAAIAHVALRRGERWAFHACALSLGVWLVVDFAASALYGAWFNVLWVELPTLVVFGVPLAFAYPRLGRRTSAGGHPES